MMEAQLLADKFNPILRRYWLPIIFAFLGLILLGYGLIGLLASDTSDELVIEKASQENAENKTQAGTIFVDIEGAVISPGVYELPKESRIKDLIIKAGGLSTGADRNWFAKNINLASKLADGSKLYIPATGEQVSGSVNTVLGTSTGTAGLININSASESQLDSLPGIGSATSAKIMQNRPYQSIEELVTKKAVSSKVLESIKDKISTY